MKSRKDLYEHFGSKLSKIENLPGISTPERFDTFIKQLVDSIRRTEYFNLLLKRGINYENYADPHHHHFHPIKAAIWHIQKNNIEEAIWLVFLYAHFGKSKTGGWNLIRSIYGRLGNLPINSWDYVGNNTNECCSWIVQNQDELRQQGTFGNHSKYKSLKMGHTDRAIMSFVNWARNNGGLIMIFQNNNNFIGLDRFHKFDLLFKDTISHIHTFGRMGAFDFLATIGKLEISDIEPGRMYISNSSGPKQGARLFFGKRSQNEHYSYQELEDFTLHLNLELELFFGMQVLEDALCNWQKEPTRYIKYSV